MKLTRMLGAALPRELPATLQSGGLVIYCDPAIDPKTLHDELRPSMDERSNRRIIEHKGLTLFCKHKRIGGLSKRLRISSSGNAVRQFRPFMEIRNNLSIRQHANAKLLAVAIYSPFGIIRSIAIVTRYLGSHVSGDQYLRDNPERAVEFTRKLLEMIKEMRALQIVHMDLWLGNVMVCEESLELSAIDHEYTLSGVPRKPEEILGFQLGFLYFQSLHNWMDEGTYSELTLKCFPGEPLHGDFQAAYNHCKLNGGFSEARLSLLKYNFPHTARSPESVNSAV